MNKTRKKTAVVLLNLGGPDSASAVYPFLINFFMDKNIIRLPIPFRCILAWLIAKRRSKNEARESYNELGGSSPLLENTKAQAIALQRTLNRDKNETETFKTFVCMRYWHPMAPQAVREVKDWGADEIFLLPLYPQYSTTTTRSSLQVWQKAMTEAGYERPTTTICCYPFDHGFVKSSAANIEKQYKHALKDGHENPRVLFSAHGLPESVIKEGDPYQWQCEEGAKKIAQQVTKNLKLKNKIDWAICYQSRVGPKKWIGPSLEEELHRAAEDKKAVIIYPHAFTQEHVETLVELDIEYKEEAEKMGITGYYRAPTVSTDPIFIDSLAETVKKYRYKHEILSNENSCLCPERFTQCCMRAMKDF